MDTSRVYGWTPSLPQLDAAVFRAPAGNLPPSTDWRKGFPGVYDQGRLGSCVDNAVAGAIQFEQIREGLPPVMPSRLFLYYGARTLQGTVQSDSGSSVANGLQAAAEWGYCPETDWPYDIARYQVQPTNACYTEALPNAITDYAQVRQTPQDIKGALAGGKPVVFGFSVYASFESQQVVKTGMVPMPRRGERMLGGHSPVLCGYDDATSLYLFRNSYGAEWGLAGYGYMPYEMVHGRLASDFWVVSSVPGGPPTPPPLPPIPPTSVMVPSYITFLDGGKNSLGTYEVGRRVT